MEPKNPKMIDDQIRRRRWCLDDVNHATYNLKKASGYLESIGLGDVAHVLMSAVPTVEKGAAGIEEELKRFGVDKHGKLLLTKG